MLRRALVIQAGLCSRPDDGRRLYFVTTDGIDTDSRSRDSVYIAPNEIDPPVSGDEVAWNKGWVIRLRDDRHYKQIGMTFDSAHTG